MLSGREIVLSNKLEPTEISPFLSRPGVGVLETPHPQGPLGEVNHEFRKFMLNRNGLFLNAVMLTSPQLGVELFLGLTIQPPRYCYDSDAYSDWRDEDLGTEGSDDIDVCTFKFLPLLSLLEINEEVAIRIVNTLCRIATHRKHRICENLDRRRIQSEENSEVSDLVDSLRADTHELTLIINGTNKKFQGERKALYWHRNCPLSPKIINCLLMTLEGWLYSRPTKSQLERSISVILNRSDTVAMLGVLVTLAKCDFSLLSRALLPLVSSLQLLVWLEFEQIDRGQNYGFDDIAAWRLLSDDRQELLEFNQLSYRRNDLQKVILNLWVNEVIPAGMQAQILEDWDTHQLSLVPEVSVKRASRIRAWFEPGNWQQEIVQGEQGFRFIGTLPEDAEADAKADSAFLNLQHLQIAMTCRQIIDGEREKTLELHDQLVALLTSEERIDSLRDSLEPQAFSNVIWAAITILLESPLKALSQELEADLNCVAEASISFPISLNHYTRCQLYNLDDSAFRSHVAPKLITRLQSNSSICTFAFRCLVGVRNWDTSAFIRSWVKEYGLEHPLTQQLVNVTPFIARLLSLTHAVIYIKNIQESSRSDGSYIVPRPEEINYEISRREDLKLEEAWLTLQNDFVESKLQQIAVVDTFAWIPEVLLQPVQQMPDWAQKRFIQHAFDWEFLTAALVPVLEIRVDSEEIQKFIGSLGEQLIFAFLHERERVYLEYKADQEEGGHRNVRTQLYQSQSQLFDKVIRSNRMNVLIQIDKLLHAFRNFNLIDCILLENIIDDLKFNLAGSDNLGASNGSLIIQIAFAIGDHLVESDSQSPSDLRILGRSSDVWEKLIELLSLGADDSESVATLDQFLVQFFSRFCEILLPHWLLRRRLYRVAKSSWYKQFRRMIFQAVVKRLDLLPNNRNDESEGLVQVLTELWDSDHSWIISKQSRCQDLRALLGRLQEVDALGARNLADQIANSLSNFSS